MSLPDKYIKDPAFSQPACGLCTPECGDPKNLSSLNLKHETAEGLKLETNQFRWFPLRIFHGSEKRQAQLEALLCEEPSVQRSYVPRNLVDADSETYVSALKNYIFVRTTLDSLRQLKADQQRYATLRYVMQPSGDGTSQIAHIPDKQMEDFMHVIQNDNEHVIMLRNMAFACKPGQRVRILRGPFEGVEGTVKSIQKHLSVVITLSGIMALAILNVPKKDIEVIENQI